MTFLELYGNALDTELGTEDRTERFTTARRQTAINNAQREWIRLTDSFIQEAQIDLSADVTEYDLEAIISDALFLRFADQQPYAQITDSDGDVTTYQGDNFPRIDPARLDLEQRGWREYEAGEPQSWYYREDGGRAYIGIVPAPDVASGEDWVLKLPFISYAADMSADTDEPFALVQPAGNPKQTLRAYHQALVHYAAYELEKLRRNYQVSKMQYELFMGYVQDYKQRGRVTGPQRVGFVHDYFGAASRAPMPTDPRR